MSERLPEVKPCESVTMVYCTACKAEMPQEKVWAADDPFTACTACDMKAYVDEAAALDELDNRYLPY